tara:strand:- start:412 stop:945 length:534 start_codon:yes stop_codon:yes gene_type:complete
MPSFNQEFLQTLNHNYLDYDTFVETGTHYGGTLSQMISLHFKNIHTIELSDKLYEYSKNKYKNDKVYFHHGDSAKELPNVCKLIETPTIFFLDGHFCYGDSAQGELDCPLYEEIDSIVKYCKHKSIIIIDDFRLFGQGSWGNISKDGIKKIVGNRYTDDYHLPSDIHEKDRWIINID